VELFLLPRSIEVFRSVDKDQLERNMTFEANFELNEVYERGAALLVILARPVEADEGRNFQLYLSLCGKAVWLKHMMEPDDWTPIAVRPQYVLRESKTIDKDVAFVARRLGERMVAGRMAIPFFQKALSPADPLPDGIARLSVNQMAELVLDDAGQAEPTNVERRYWAPSRPVIHLAAAAAITVQRLKKAGKPIVLETFLFNRDFVDWVVQMAEGLRVLAARDPKFPVKSEQLIRFRLT
jgi:hypothetical protein